MYIVFVFCTLCLLVQTELIKSGAVIPSEADQLVNDILIPMIGNQQKIYEANMEQIDVSCLLLHVQLIDVNIIVHVYASIEIQLRVIVTNVLCMSTNSLLV